MKIQISIAKIGPFQFLSACMCCHLLKKIVILLGGKKLSAKEAREMLPRQPSPVQPSIAQVCHTVHEWHVSGILQFLNKILLPIIRTSVKNQNQFFFLLRQSCLVHSDMLQELTFYLNGLTAEPSNLRSCDKGKNIKTLKIINHP